MLINYLTFILIHLVLVVTARNHRNADIIITAFTSKIPKRRLFLYNSEIHGKDGTTVPNFGSNNDNDDESECTSEEEDWRDFRARLVLGEQHSTGEDQDSSSTSRRQGSSRNWAYETGRLVERGSIVLSQPKPAFGGGLLRHPFWHKAVMLILDHDEKEQTHGIILNRPSDVTLDGGTDDSSINNNDRPWRVWYGGPVCSGIPFASSDNAELICLHTVTSERARDVSTTIMKNIQYTSIEDARELVKSGYANSDDFWVFAGYCGWNTGQLVKELKDGCWITAVTDSETLIKELTKHSTNDVEPRAAGLDTWNTLICMIKGTKHVDLKTPETFDDLLVKEWVRDQLLHHQNESEKRELTFTSSRGEIDIRAGMLCRAVSPILLSDQDMHKSIVLVVNDNVHGTIGVFLNLPTTKMVTLSTSTSDDKGGSGEPVALLQRYGGSYVVFGEGERPLLWLHCNHKLRSAGVGIPLDDSLDGEGIWECTPNDVALAIRSKLASPKDFMVVSGGYIWGKSNDGKVGGIRAQIWDGRFELVPLGRTQAVWDTLLNQNLLSIENVDENIDIASLAWDLAGSEYELNKVKYKDSLVFDSNVTVSELADEALHRWVAKYILDKPSNI